MLACLVFGVSCAVIILLEKPLHSCIVAGTQSQSVPRKFQLFGRLEDHLDTCCRLSKAETMSGSDLKLQACSESSLISVKAFGPRIFKSSLGLPADANQDREFGSQISELQLQGIKLEGFIFDTFAISEQPTLMEVRREEEFAPVKNAPGSAKDSPDTARAAVLALHKRYVS